MPGGTLNGVLRQAERDVEDEESALERTGDDLAAAEARHAEQLARTGVARAARRAAAAAAAAAGEGNAARLLPSTVWRERSRRGRRRRVHGASHP